MRNESIQNPYRRVISANRAWRNTIAGAAVMAGLIALPACGVASLVDFSAIEGAVTPTARAAEESAAASGAGAVDGRADEATGAEEAYGARTIAVSLSIEGDGAVAADDGGEYDAEMHEVRFAADAGATVRVDPVEGGTVEVVKDDVAVELADNRFSLTADDEGAGVVVRFAAPVAPAVESEQPAEPACEEPSYDEPAYDGPACSEPACEEPVIQSCEEPACDEPAYEEPSYEEDSYYGGRPEAPYVDCDPMDADEWDLAQSIFAYYNQYRVDCGLPAVVWDSGCASMATSSSQQCAAQQYLSHRLGIPADLQYDFSDILQFATWRMDPEEAVVRWSNSEGHRKQMVCPTATRAGVGVYRDEYDTYWFAIVYDFQGTNVGY